MNDCCGNCFFARPPVNAPPEDFVDCHEDSPKIPLKAVRNGSLAIQTAGVQQVHGFMLGVWLAVPKQEWCGHHKPQTKESAVDAA